MHAPIFFDAANFQPLLRHREGGAARAHRGGGEDEEELEEAGHECVFWYSMRAGMAVAMASKAVAASGIS